MLQELNEDNLLYIPPEWSYFYEVKNDVILSHIECDSYPSVLFNYLRKKKINVNLHYIPVHLHPYYRKLGFKEGEYKIALTFSFLIYFLIISVIVAITL